MKTIATGAFLVMVAIFFLTNPLGNDTIFWLIRWDHVNAFAEASMVGALADWFAVVALFRHPLGIPIWHTAIIPRKKDDIGRNLGTFVETRLLSVENLRREIGNFSVSRSILQFLSIGENRGRAAGWLADALAAVVRSLDEAHVKDALGAMATARLKEMNAAGLLGRGLDMVIESGRHHELIDHTLRQAAAWIPSRRDTVQEFIERSVQRTLKWGSMLVPNAVIERATEQTLTALIEVLNAAADDPQHPLRADLNARVEAWAEQLKHDPDLTERINRWKDQAIEHETVRNAIGDIWTQARDRLLADLDDPDSRVRAYAVTAVEHFSERLAGDEALQSTIDERLRQGAIGLLSNNHHAIGSLVQRVVDSWEGEQLSREMELNLGRDLQYIRLNGTFIGGFVGLLIHLLR